MVTLLSDLYHSQLSLYAINPKDKGGKVTGCKTLNMVLFPHMCSFIRLLMVGQVEGKSHTRHINEMGAVTF